MGETRKFIWAAYVTFHLELFRIHSFSPPIALTEKYSRPPVNKLDFPLAENGTKWQ